MDDLDEALHLSNMEEIKICRVCLVVDVKMHDLQEYPLNAYFEPIIGINPLSTIQLPNYACFECAALIKKYYTFRERCFRGQTVLYELMQYDNQQITPEKLKTINREKLQLSSNLKTKFTGDNDLIPAQHTEIDRIPDLYDLIKDETSQKQINNEIQEENNKIESKLEFEHDVEVKEIKLEDDFFDVPLAAPSSDDEPLSLHKIAKEKKKKKGSKKKKKICAVQDDANDINIEPIDGVTEPSELTEVIPEKRKRGRPKKQKLKVDEPKPRRTQNTGGVDEDDLADLEEYVTIIKLTHEEQLEEVDKRKSSSNYMNSQYQCELCYKGFIDTKAWEHHVERHSKASGSEECPICKFHFKTRRALQKHVSIHEKKYACKACSYVSKTTTQAKQHQRWHKGVTYKCQYCDEISTKWTSYLSHVRIKHPSEHICGACGYSFVSALGLAMHQTMMHKELKEPAAGAGAAAAAAAAGAAAGAGAAPQCRECGVQFTNMEAWKRHLVTSAKHIKDEEFGSGCRVCGDTFPDAEALRLHHRRLHARKRPKNYGKREPDTKWPANCEHCSEEIPNAREYWTHFRRAHPALPYPLRRSHICEICGKSFRGNAFLVYHRRTHSEDRQFRCSICPKAFHNRVNLHMHQKTHSDHRPHPCSVCFKAFKCKAALERHFRSHTGVKPYPCEVCGKAFGQSNSRKLHVRTVHLREPAPYLSRARQARRDT